MKVSSLKHLMLIALFSYFIVSQQLIAQENQEFRTLLGNTKGIRVSGFGGSLIEFSSVTDEFAVSNGGGGALLLNNIFIGGYGLGLSTLHYKDLCYLHPASSSTTPYNYSNDRISFGHGGFWLGGIIKPNSAIHLSISSKFGWGAISFLNPENRSKPSLYFVQDEVFVLTPQIEAEMNITRWFKFNIGVGYRYVAGVDKEFLNIGCNTTGSPEWQQFFNQDEFNSPVLSLSLLFGWFE